MSDLHEKNCIPCRGGIPPFDISEIHKYLKKVDGWDVKKREIEFYWLEKIFSFKRVLKNLCILLKLVIQLCFILSSCIFKFLFFFGSL